MLQIRIPETEFWDDSKQQFVYFGEQKLQLEHSLVSLSKWEARWHKPFFTKDKKTIEESIDYIKCMTITQNIAPEIYQRLTNDNIQQVNDYIEDSMTATWFSEYAKKKKVSSEQVTSELIYYWMVALNIPFECQKWHLNRLFTLIRVCEAKNQPSKKMSQKEIINRNRALNASRRKRLNSKG